MLLLTIFSRALSESFRGVLIGVLKEPLRESLRESLYGIPRQGVLKESSENPSAVPWESLKISLRGSLRGVLQECLDESFRQPLVPHRSP